MSRFDFSQHPFFPQGHVDVMAPLLDIANQIEQPPVDGESFTRHLAPYVVKQPLAAISFNRYVTTEAELLVGLSDPKDVLEQFVVFDALRGIGRDVQLRTLVMTAAVNKGVQLGRGNEEAAAKIDTAADSLILARARHSLSMLLRSHGLMVDRFEDIEPVSVWDRAIDLHQRNPKIKPPRPAGTDDLADFDIQRGRAAEASTVEKTRTKKSWFSRGTSKIGFAAFAIKELVETARADSSIDYVVELLGTRIEAELPTQVSFTKEQIPGLVRTMERMRQYIDSSAILDPSLSNDPRARYAMFLGKELKSWDVRSEKSIFDIRAKRIAKREQRVRSNDDAYLE